MKQNMSSNITVAGNLVADYVKKIDSYPVRGSLSSVSEISRGVGGTACSTSIALAKLDRSVKVNVLGRVGDDENGRYIRELIAGEGIRSEIIIDDNLPTSFTDVMSDEQGERTFFHARGANAAFCPDDIPLDKLDCDIFHIGYILLLDSMDAFDSEYGTVLARTLAKIRSSGIKTSIDVVSENSDRFKKIVTPSLKYCDYVIINENEASLITGLPARDPDGFLPDKNVKQMLERLAELGVHEMITIHTPEGGWALSHNSGHVFSPSLDLPNEIIKGNVGAGDAFCAGMLYGLYKEFDLQKALEFAAGTAACNLTEANSTDGLRDYNGVSEMIDRWGFRK